LLVPLSHCFAHVHEALTVDQLAAYSQVSRKTLLHWFLNEGWPAPGSVIVWTKLFVAARYLTRSGRTMSAVAETVGLPSATSLRLAFKRYTGLSPKEIRKGGFGMVLRPFIASLAFRPADRPEIRYLLPAGTEPLEVSSLPELNGHYPQ